MAGTSAVSADSLPFHDSPQACFRRCLLMPLDRHLEDYAVGVWGLVRVRDLRFCDYVNSSSLHLVRLSPALATFLPLSLGRGSLGGAFFSHSQCDLAGPTPLSFPYVRKIWKANREAWLSARIVCPRLRCLLFVATARRSPLLSWPSSQLSP